MPAPRVQRKCLKRGGTADACSKAADDARTACLAGVCSPPPPDTCDVDCEQRAQDAKDQCTADGTDSAQCDSLAQGMLDECQQSCGTAPDQTCSEQCEQAARKRHDTVLHTTRNQTRATRRGQRVFRRCSRTCD